MEMVPPIQRFLSIFTMAIIFSSIGSFFLYAAKSIHHPTLRASNHPFVSSISASASSPLPIVSCSSIPINAGYNATYHFFQHTQALNLPCVLFGGSAIGVKRHHGIIPNDKDIDIACFSTDWNLDSKRLEHILNQINTNWFVSLQGYNVPIKNSPYFLDIWLHGPATTTTGTIDDPTKCIGFSKQNFNSFPMLKILPELASYLIKKPNKKLNRKKHEWTTMTNNTCNMFYTFFGRQYGKSNGENFGKGPPTWKKNLFFSSSNQQRKGLFGNRLVPIPEQIDQYIEQRYGNVMVECGQSITGNAGKCNTDSKWVKHGMVHYKYPDTSNYFAREEIFVKNKKNMHTIYYCNGVQSCTPNLKCIEEK